MRARLDDLRRRLEAISPRTALLACGAIVALTVVIALIAFPVRLDQRLGVDYWLYRDATRVWLGGAPFYPIHQLRGPYDITAGDILYPPVAIWLFVPFAIPNGPELSVLMAAVWWLVPLGATAIAIVALRPRPWTWPILVLCLSNPTVILKIWTGNPVIWSMAALAVACVLPWRTSAPFVLLKPSLAPFALFGIRRRSWWIGAAALVALSLPFGGLWADWLTTVVNSRGGGLLYSSLEAPFLLLPLAAWLGRRRDLGRVPTPG